MTTPGLHSTHCVFTSHWLSATRAGAEPLEIPLPICLTLCKRLLLPLSPSLRPSLASPTLVPPPLDSSTLLFPLHPLPDHCRCPATRLQGTLPLPHQPPLHTARPLCPSSFHTVPYSSSTQASGCSSPPLKHLIVSPHPRCLPYLVHDRYQPRPVQGWPVLSRPICSCTGPHRALPLQTSPPCVTTTTPPSSASGSMPASSTASLSEPLSESLQQEPPPSDNLLA